jgi:predicted heme/steroid binding protein
MKKYIISISIAISAGFCSCSDMLDLQNDGRTTMDQIFATRDGVRGYLNSCYSYSPAPNYEKAYLCDEAQSSDDNFANSFASFWYGNALAAGTYWNTDGYPWSRYYEGIRRCNVFLTNMAKASTIYASEGELTGWIAQAQTLRAFYYLQLIKRYGEIPILTEPYATAHDYAGDHKSSFSEVTALILEDCDDALSAPDIGQGFSWNVYNGQSGIMTRAVAYAIKSEAITYAASPLWADGTYTWADATRINSEAIAQCLTHGYSLFNDTPDPEIAQNTYALYFITRPDEQRAYDKETIYGRTGVAVWQNDGLPSTAGQAKAGTCPTQEMVDSYEMALTGEPPITGYSDARHLNPVLNPAASDYNPADPYAGRDPRFYASIYYNGAIRRLDEPASRVSTSVGAQEGISVTDRRYTHTGYYLRKYNNWKSGRDNSADGAVRLFRLAEIYLNFAESAYQSNVPDAVIDCGNGISMSARDAVGAIRTRAGMPPFPVNMPREDFEKKYRNERRVELAFEEHRYFDVRRWKILEQTERYVTGMRITQNGAGFDYERIGFSRGSWIEKYYLYPLSQEEVNKMQDQTGTDWQNPGWN